MFPPLPLSLPTAFPKFFTHTTWVGWRLYPSRSVVSVLPAIPAGLLAALLLGVLLVFLALFPVLVGRDSGLLLVLPIVPLLPFPPFQGRQQVQSQQGRARGGGLEDMLFAGRIFVLADETANLRVQISALQSMD